MRFRVAFRMLLISCLATPVLAGCADDRQDIADAPPDVAPAAGVTQPSSTVFFALGSDQLTAEAQSTIRAAAAAVAARNATTVAVTGHADTLGSTDSNERLSERRAQAVAEALAANGIPEDRITVDWVGERMLSVPTSDGTPEEANRIVTIKL